MWYYKKEKKWYDTTSEKIGKEVEEGKLGDYILLLLLFSERIDDKTKGIVVESLSGGAEKAALYGETCRELIKREEPYLWLYVFEKIDKAQRKEEARKLLNFVEENIPDCREKTVLLLRKEAGIQNLLSGETDWKGVCNSQFYNPIDGKETEKKMKKNLLYIWSGHGDDVRPFHLTGLAPGDVNGADDFIENEVFHDDGYGYFGFKEERILSFGVISMSSGAKTLYKKIAPNKWSVEFKGTLDPEEKGESAYLDLFFENVLEGTLEIKQINENFADEFSEYMKKYQYKLNSGE